jgi:hypothetical protein
MKKSNIIFKLYYVINYVIFIFHNFIFNKINIKIKDDKHLKIEE